MKTKRTSVLHLHTVLQRILSLVQTPLFWFFTLSGNLFILLGAFSFYFFEKEKNPAIHGFLDSFVWAIGIVTTVGAGYYPVTSEGKIIGIVMMIGGAVFLWTYMALFVGALVDPELRKIEKEVSEIQHERQYSVKTNVGQKS